jgi:hypothetical protein
MKRYILSGGVLICSLCLIFLVLASSVASAQNVIVDISQATFEITGPTSFTIHNAGAQAPELGIVQGMYWADFQWDTLTHMLVPVNFGPEQPSVPPTVDISGTYSGYYYVTFPSYQPSMVTVVAGIAQSGTKISGNWYTNTGEAGTITGTIASASSITLNFAATNCQDTATFSGSFYDGTISFTGTGFNQNCGTYGAYGSYSFSGVLTRD